MKYDFTDKTTYLAWRAKWKADYKELSVTIRAAKRACKQFIRRYERSVNAAGQPVRTLIAKEPNPYTYPDGYTGQESALATFMLEQLKEAKALSWSLKLASRQSSGEGQQASKTASPVAA